LDTRWGTVGKASGQGAQALLEPIAQSRPTWSGLPIALMLLPGEATAEAVRVEHPTMAVARSGAGRRRYAVAGRTRELYSAPNMVELYGDDFQIDHGWWQGTAGELVAIQFPPALVHSLLHEEHKHFKLPTRHELFDNELATLALHLWNDAESGTAQGSLYAQGLTLALLGRLLERHGATQAGTASKARRFSSSQQARIREFIETGLASALTVERLALLVGMSPRHFARVFRATFDHSVHDYVLQKRIEAACRSMREEPDCSIALIASSVGFSSQSHFAEAFRGVMGMPPSHWRNDH
jgi:AraC family transcriptional regulator